MANKSKVESTCYNKTVSNQENEEAKKRWREMKWHMKVVIPLKMYSDVIKLIKTYRHIRRRARAPKTVAKKKGFGGIKLGQPKSSEWFRRLLDEHEVQKKIRAIIEARKHTQLLAPRVYEWPRHSLVPIVNTDLGGDWSAVLNHQLGCSSSLLQRVPLQQPGSPSERNCLHEREIKDDDGDGVAPGENVVVYDGLGRQDATRLKAQSENGDDSRDKIHSPRQDGCRNEMAFNATGESADVDHLRSRGDTTKVEAESPSDQTEGQSDEDDPKDMNYSPTQDSSSDEDDPKDMNYSPTKDSSSDEDDPKDMN